MYNTVKLPNSGVYNQQWYGPSNNWLALYSYLTVGNLLQLLVKLTHGVFIKSFILSTPKLRNRWCTISIRSLANISYHIQSLYIKKNNKLDIYYFMQLFQFIGFMWRWEERFHQFWYRPHAHVASHQQYSIWCAVFLINAL